MVFLQVLHEWFLKVFTKSAQQNSNKSQASFSSAKHVRRSSARVFYKTFSPEGCRNIFKKGSNKSVTSLTFLIASVESATA